MPRYKEGDKIKSGRYILTVVRGRCDDCFFSVKNVRIWGGAYCVAKLPQSCSDSFGGNLICKKLSKGL